MNPFDSVQKEVYDSNYHFIIISKICIIKNDVQRKRRPPKIINHLKTGLVIALFFYLKHFKYIKYIALIKICQWSVFLWTNLHRIMINAEHRWGSKYPNHKLKIICTSLFMVVTLMYSFHINWKNIHNAVNGKLNGKKCSVFVTDCTLQQCRKRIPNVYAASPRDAMEY